jgi:hypothetical protein
MSHRLQRTITKSSREYRVLYRRWFVLFLLLAMPLSPGFAQTVPLSPLPSPQSEDIPEEVARLQPIEHARSPEDNRLLTPAEYALLQEELQKAQETRAVSPRLRQLILLLRIRKVLKTIVPFF